MGALPTPVTWMTSDEFPDYYLALGIDRTATRANVHSAYRALALRWHPDRNPPELQAIAHERFVLINEAHEVLHASGTRIEYNRGYDARHRPPAPARPSPTHPDEPVGTLLLLAYMLAGLLSTFGCLLAWYFSMGPLRRMGKRYRRLKAVPFVLSPQGLAQWLGRAMAVVGLGRIANLKGCVAGGALLWFYGWSMQFRLNEPLWIGPTLKWALFVAGLIYMLGAMPQKTRN